MPELTFERLRDAVAGDAVALRSRMTLQPAGGEGDKVFPPSYAVDGRADHKYAVEERHVGDSDEVSVTVLLDSVASQANRAELALLEGWERGELAFPVPYVDFVEDDGVTDYERVTALEPRAQRTPSRLRIARHVARGGTKSWGCPAPSMVVKRLKSGPPPRHRRQFDGHAFAARQGIAQAEQGGWIVRQQAQGPKGGTFTVWRFCARARRVLVLAAAVGHRPARMPSAVAC